VAHSWHGFDMESGRIGGQTRTATLSRPPMPPARRPNGPRSSLARPRNASDPYALWKRGASTAAARRLRPPPGTGGRPDRANAAPARATAEPVRTHLGATPTGLALPATGMWGRGGCRLHPPRDPISGA